MSSLRDSEAEDDFTDMSSLRDWVVGSELGDAGEEMMSSLRDLEAEDYWLCYRYVVPTGLGSWFRTRGCR
jgi:hypothetical protein